MIIGMYIGLAIFGVMTLVRGKMTISKTKVVVGIPARLLALVAFTPFPLALVIAIAYVAINAPADPERFAREQQLTIALIEGACAVGVAIFVFAVGAMLAISPAEAERRERGSRYEEDDYDDRRSRRRDQDSDDDDQDDRDGKPWNR